jgi:predicted DNA-binding protein
MVSPQFSIRIPSELDERLNDYAKQVGMTKTRVMIDALAHYLGCGGDVPLVRRVIEIEERLAALEVEVRGN